MADLQEMLSVSVWRGGPAAGGYVDFKIPAHESQTILDVVVWIQQNLDPTLSYRFACRVGMCGSCAMTVNGVPRWTCRTHVKKVTAGNVLQIGPLRNLPVIKDLATDMDPFFDKWIAAEGKHHPSRTRHAPLEPVDPTSPGRVAADQGIECINCSVCYAACDTVAGNPDYLGPAALLRAWTVFNDEKNADSNAVLTAVSGRDGCHNCHAMGSCQQHCPNGLNPMTAIAGLKKEGIKSLFRNRK